MVGDADGEAESMSTLGEAVLGVVVGNADGALVGSRVGGAEGGRVERPAKF